MSSVELLAAELEEEKEAAEEERMLVSLRFMHVCVSSHSKGP